MELAHIAARYATQCSDSGHRAAPVNHWIFSGSFMMQPRLFPQVFLPLPVGHSSLTRQKHSSQKLSSATKIAAEVWAYLDPDS